MYRTLETSGVSFEANLLRLVLRCFVKVRDGQRPTIAEFRRSCDLPARRRLYVRLSFELSQFPLAYRAPAGQMHSPVASSIIILLLEGDGPNA
jgi:hypothetical protein